MGAEGGTALKMTPWHLTACREDGGNLPEKPAAERSSAVCWQEVDLLPLMSKIYAKRQENRRPAGQQVF